MVQYSENYKNYLNCCKFFLCPNMCLNTPSREKKSPGICEYD